MDIIGISRLMEEMIKEVQKTETYCIHFYSTDYKRDFDILDKKIKGYRNRLSELLSNGHTSTEQAGACIGEGDLPKESV